MAHILLTYLQSCFACCQFDRSVLNCSIEDTKERGYGYAIRRNKVMQRLAVLIISDAEDAGMYRSLQLNGERHERCALKDAVDCLKREKADVIVLDCGNRVWTGLSMMSQI